MCGEFPGFMTMELQRLKMLFRGVPVWGTAICFMERNRTKLCCIPFTEPSADNIFLCGNRWLGDKFS